MASFFPDFSKIQKNGGLVRDWFKPQTSVVNKDFFSLNVMFSRLSVLSGVVTYASRASSDSHPQPDRPLAALRRERRAHALDKPSAPAGREASGVLAPLRTPCTHPVAGCQLLPARPACERHTQPPSHPTPPSLQPASLLAIPTHSASPHLLCSRAIRQGHVQPVPSRGVGVGGFCSVSSINYAAAVERRASSAAVAISKLSLSRP